jgi:hypothetical protein
MKRLLGCKVWSWLGPRFRWLRNRPHVIAAEHQTFPKVEGPPVTVSQLRSDS